MDRLEQINKSITEIRKILGAECAPITDLPEKVRTLSEQAVRGGFTTVFVFSGDSNPNKPSGGSLNTTTGLVEGLDGNWTQSVVAGQRNVFMSFATFSPEGVLSNDWSTPLNLRGLQGDPGQDGPQGPAGEQGPQGEPGKDGEDGAPGKDGEDGKDGQDGKDGVDGETGANGEPGRGIKSITKLFAVNNDPKNYPTEGWTNIESVSTSPTNRYMWCEETTEFTSGDPTVIHYIAAIEGEPGASGTGGDAPVIYPAGVWDDEKTYTSTDSKVPYVYYLSVDESGNPKEEESGYYILKEGLGEYRSSTTPNLDSNWEKIDSFNAVYSDIGLFNQALVGKWVFHGNYMFSQEGVDDLGAEKTYNEFDDPKEAIEKGEFIPNICMNTVDGSAYFAGFTIDKNGFSYAKDGQYANISSTGIRYSNSDTNGYFELNNKGDAKFSSGNVKFNADGSGEVGEGMKWNENGELTLSNPTLFKSAHITTGSVDLDEKQQWVLNAEEDGGTRYENNSECLNNNITNIGILNVGENPAVITYGDIPFVLGGESGILVVPKQTLFTGMTYNGNCFCSSNYIATKCSGGKDGDDVQYLTPWENPGYDMIVKNAIIEHHDLTCSLLDSTPTTILDITVSCPIIKVGYDVDTVNVVNVSDGGSDQRLYFTLDASKAGQSQYYINIYFYFNELCVGQFLISGNVIIYDD